MVYWLLGLVWAIALLVLGYKTAPLWLPLIVAIIGAFLYAGARPAAKGMFGRAGITLMALTLFVTQTITAYILYGIGRGIRAIAG